MKRRKKTLQLSLSLLIAILLFFGLLTLESRILNKQKKVMVVQSVCNVSAGTLITETNVKNYFTEKQVEASYGMNDGITNINQLNNYLVTENITMNQIVRESQFISKDSVIANIKEPIEVSIKADSAAQIVGGILREGDVIDLSVVNNTTSVNTEVLKNVYVVKAINTDGSIIPKTDEKTSALTINIIIDKTQEAYLNEQLSMGGVRMSKVDINKQNHTYSVSQAAIQENK